MNNSFVCCFSIHVTIESLALMSSVTKKKNTFACESHPFTSIFRKIDTKVASKHSREVKKR